MVRAAGFTSLTPGRRPRAAGGRAGRRPAARRRARRAARGRARCSRCSSTRRAMSRSWSAAGGRAPGRSWSRSRAPSTTGRRSSSAPGWRGRSSGRCGWPARAPARRPRRQPAARQRLARAAACARRARRAGDRRACARSARRGRRATPASSWSASPSAGGARGSDGPRPRSRLMPACRRCCPARPASRRPRRARRRHALHVDDRDGGRLISAPTAAAARAGTAPGVAGDGRGSSSPPIDWSTPWMVRTGSARRGRRRPIRTSLVETTRLRGCRPADRAAEQVGAQRGERGREPSGSPPARSSPRGTASTASRKPVHERAARRHCRARRGNALRNARRYSRTLALRVDVTSCRRPRQRTAGRRAASGSSTIPGPTTMWRRVRRRVARARR